MSLGQPFKNSKWLWQVGSCIYLQQVGVLQHRIIRSFRTQQPERWHVHRNQNILIQRWNHFIASNILFVFKALNGWTPQHIWLTVVLTFGTNLLPFNKKHVEFTRNKSAEWIKLLSISFVKTWDALVDQLHFDTLVFILQQFVFPPWWLLSLYSIVLKIKYNMAHCCDLIVD